MIPRYASVSAGETIMVKTAFHFDMDQPSADDRATVGSPLSQQAIVM